MVDGFHCHQILWFCQWTPIFFLSKNRFQHTDIKHVPSKLLHPKSGVPEGPEGRGGVEEFSMGHLVQQRQKKLLELKGVLLRRGALL